MKRRPNWIVILLIALPLAAVVGGLVTLVVASEDGFTHVEGVERIPGAH